MIELLIIKEIEKEYQIEQNNIMKITKKYWESKQEKNIDKYLMKKRYEKRKWNK